MTMSPYLSQESGLSLVCLYLQILPLINSWQLGGEVVYFHF